MKKKEVIFNGENIYVEGEYEDDIVFARYINYMKKALRNRKLNFLRNQKHLLEKEISMSKREWEIMSNDNNFTHSFLCGENYKSKKLENALKTLTEKQKKVIILYYYENKKLKEIARQMDMNENAVKQLKLRAISKLKEYLEGKNEK